MVVIAGRRPALGVLGFVSIWTIAAVGWGQVLPRLSAWPGLFPTLVWASTLTALWLVAQPSRGVLRNRFASVVILTVGLVGMSALIGLLPDRVAIQLLGWGHDNSAHIFLAEANAACGGLLSACQSGLESVPSYLIEYPQGFSATWASLPGAFAGSGLIASTPGYTAIYLLASLALVAVSAWLAVSFAQPSRWAWGAGVLSVLVLVFGVWSHQFWSGFASFLWASLIIVAFVVLREAKILVTGRLWFSLALGSLVAVYYTHQLLLPFITVYVAVDALRGRSSLLSIVRKAPALIGGIAVVSVLLVALAPPSAQGNSFLDQVVVEAGMEVLPLWVWVPLTVVGGFVVFARGDRDRVALRWAMLTSGGLFAGLALLTIRVNGYVSYYPMKLLTFLTLILIASSAAVVVAKPIETRARQAWFTLSGIAVLGLALLPPLLRYPGFKTAYQGSTPTALRTLAYDVYGGGVALCAPFVLEALDRLPPNVGRVEVYRNGQLQPLEGRWINSIRGHWETTAWRNEVDWRPMEEIPQDQLPDIILSHDSAGRTPEGVPRLVLGELCDRQQLPSVLQIG
jgi:hypothetical protein